MIWGWSVGGTPVLHADRPPAAAHLLCRVGARARVCVCVCVRVVWCLCVCVYVYDVVGGGWCGVCVCVCVWRSSAVGL